MSNDKYYLWCLEEGDGFRVGIVTRRRNPVGMTLSDILGEYVMDAIAGYSGNMTESEFRDISQKRSSWKYIVNTESDGNDVLRIFWRYEYQSEYETGIDILNYEGEVDIPFKDDFNYSVSFQDLKNMWYEKSGQNVNFDPDNIDASSFYNHLGIWEDLDSENRVLWCGGASNFSSGSVSPIFPFDSSLQEDINIYTYEYGVADTQLLRVKDIPDFELLNVGFNGSILCPPMSGGGKLDVSLFYNCPSYSWYTTPYIFYNVNTFSPNQSVNVSVGDKIYYNDLSRGLSVPDYLQLRSFFTSYNGQRVITDASYNPTIPVTFSNGDTFVFNVTSKVYNTSGGSAGSYTVNLNSNWRKSTSISNPNSSLYDGVYESYSNHNVGSGVATMTITIKGYREFTLYIRSYAEGNFDYVMVSQLDKSITGSTSTTNTTLVKAHTKGKQSSNTAIGGYTAVTYTNMTGGQHTITIVYRKDGSVDNNDDRGYVLISKSNVDYSVGVVTSDITAICSNPNKFSLSSIGKVSNIDYSNLMFVMDDSGSGDSGSGDSGSGGEDTTVSYKLYYLDYWLGTGIDGKIYLSTEANNFSINATTGDFVSLNGASTLLGNVSFTVGGSGIYRYIQFDSNELKSIMGQTCYFRVKCLSGSATLYLCFKVKVTDTNFTPLFTSGGCTLWLSMQYGSIDLFYSGDDTMYIYPVEGYYSNGKRVDGAIYNTFAHGHFDTTNNMSNLTLNYNCGALNTIDIECEVGQVVSLISPICLTMENLITYLQNSPSIEISDNR